jgi:hypothetical protein
MNSLEQSSEELNQMERSTKKQKGGVSSFSPQRPLRSYRDSIIQPECNWEITPPLTCHHPWFIRQQFLSLRHWTPGFRPSEAKITTTTVWTRLPELPIELYDAGILRRIGNQLGTLLKIDARTVDSVRGRFARLCVQIDLDQPLTPKGHIGSIRIIFFFFFLMYSIIFFFFFHWLPWGGGLP